MDKAIPPDDVIRKYLLLQASASEQEWVELSALTHTNFHHHLEMIEDELIDDYVFDRLTSEEHTQFERHFHLTPGRLNSLRFAQAMRLYLESKCTAHY